MFSKFSVIPKFYKYFQNNVLLHMSRYKTPSQRSLSNIFQNEYSTRNFILLRRDISSIFCISSDNSGIYCKGDRYIKLIRNMSSKKCKGWNGENVKRSEISESNNLTIVEKCKQIFRRRSKVKCSNKQDMKCKKSKQIIERNLNCDRLIQQDQTREDPVAPYSKVHVEFMESQNLKDFEIPKRPTLRNIISINANEMKTVLNNNAKPTGKGRILPSLQKLSNLSQNLQQQNALRALKCGEIGTLKGNVSKATNHKILAKNPDSDKLNKKLLVDQNSFKNLQNISETLANTIAKGSAISRTAKLTKCKRRGGRSTKRGNKGGNRSENRGGDGGNKNTDEEIPKTLKDKRSRFWRATSLYILSFILGITVYTYNNAEAQEMFRNFVTITHEKEQLALKVLRAFAEKESKNEDDGYMGDPDYRK